jgi:hypothetical protein
MPLGVRNDQSDISYVWGSTKVPTFITMILSYTILLVFVMFFGYVISRPIIMHRQKKYFHNNSTIHRNTNASESPNAIWR